MGGCVGGWMDGWVYVWVKIESISFVFFDILTFRHLDLLLKPPQAVTGGCMGG